MAKMNKGILDDVMANVLLNMEGFFLKEGMTACSLLTCFNLLFEHTIQLFT